MQAAQCWAATRSAAPTCCAAQAKEAEEMGNTAHLPDGAAKKTSQPRCQQVFDLMEVREYGFNKSHATAYCSSAPAIKVHCTAGLFAANMTVEMDDTDKLRSADDAKRLEKCQQPA